MTQFEAKRVTRKAFRFALAGAAFGIALSIGQGPGIIFACAYWFWSAFYGVRIVTPVINYLYDFGPVHLEVRSVPALFWKAFWLKQLKWILMLLFGCTIGVFGGALIYQMYLLAIVFRD